MLEQFDRYPFSFYKSEVNSISCRGYFDIVVRNIMLDTFLVRQGSYDT